jgi:hypothetical protein
MSIGKTVLTFVMYIGLSDGNRPLRVWQGAKRTAALPVLLTLSVMLADHSLDRPIVDQELLARNCDLFRRRVR